MKKIFLVLAAVFWAVAPAQAQKISYSFPTSIDGVAIGQVVPAAGAFTTLVNGGVAQSPYAASPLFGTGADGSVTISSGTTTLTRDMHYANMTLSGTGAINTHGFRIFVSNTTDISQASAGAIFGASFPGGNASGASAGSAGSSNYNSTTTTWIMGGWSGNSGASGGTGSGSAGTAGAWGGGSGTAYGIGGSPGSSGAGGSGSNTGGASVSITATSGSSATFITPTIGPFFGAQAGNGTFWPICVNASIAASGSAGGGDSTNSGGGGGGSAGMPQPVALFSRFIQRGTNTTSGIIQSRGNTGGNGGNSLAGNTGGGGGGGGSGGGFVYIVTEALLGSTIPNAIDVSGGNGGSGGNGTGTGKGGNGGTGGNSGNVQMITLSASSGATTGIANGSTVSGYLFGSTTFNGAGTAGSTTSTATGAAGGAGAVMKVGM